jgi:hypothetical protein
MIASKGALEGSVADGEGFCGRFWAAAEGFVKSVIELDERRSVAEETRPAMPDVVLWSWEDAYILPHPHQYIC